jgi:hypothetical protein
MRATLPLLVLTVVAGTLGCASADSGADPDESSAAQTASAPPIRRQADLQVILERVVRRVYPELTSYDIQLSPFTSEQDFFRSDITIGTVLASAAHRTYRVRYNTRVFDDPPPTDAVEAILVHEVKHISDYSKKSSVGFVFWAIGYGLCSDNSKYERQTDVHALEAGFGRGLAAYRTWLYAHVDAATEKEKRATYYTPAEIEAYLAGHPPPVVPADPAEGHYEALPKAD